MAKKKGSRVKGERRNLPSKNVFYVYALIDPRDGKPFYIGKGVGDRKEHHVRAWKSSYMQGKVNQKKNTRITEIHRSGQSVVAKTLHGGLTEGAAIRKERELISALRGSLTNLGAGQRLPAQIELDACEDALARLRSPASWMRHFLRTHNRMCTASEMRLYFDVAKELIACRTMASADVSAEIKTNQ